MAHDTPLGFDALVSTGEGDNNKGEYTVEFSMTEAAEIEPASSPHDEPDKRGGSEEVGLLGDTGEGKVKKEIVSCKILQLSTIEKLKKSQLLAL